MTLDIAFTRFTSPDPLSKRYDLDEYGRVARKPAASMTTGRAVKMTLDFATFGDCLDKAGPKVAFCYGLHDAEKYGDPVKIATGKTAKPDKNILARTREYFDYRPVPGIVMIDHDPAEDGQTFTPGELSIVLSDIHPAFKESACWARGSVSAGVHKAGEPVKEGKGFHLYFAVPDASDIPRYGKVLFQRLWLNGHGRIALSSAGSCLVRGPIDESVFNGERLDFVGEPVVGDGLELTKPEPVFVPGGWLDTRTLPDLTDEEKTRFDWLVAKAKDAVYAPAQDKRREWGKGKIREMVERGVPERQAKAQVYRLTNNMGHDLYGNWLLDFNAMGAATVGDVLANPARYE